MTNDERDDTPLTFGALMLSCNALLAEHPEYADLPVIAPIDYSPVDGAPQMYGYCVDGSVEAGHWHDPEPLEGDESFQVASELEPGEEVNAVLIFPNMM